MKKVFFFLFAFATSISIFAQPASKLETARSFMRSGDYENAVIVLKRALEDDKNNLELQKELVMSYYLKRDFQSALAGAESLIDRSDADEVSFQIAGNVYKALEQPKDAEKMYKKALKKFPKSGPLYSEFGELLWSMKNFSAIEQWEKGIQVDPSFSGNYYNAARYYFYTKDKVWSIIYGEIFVNMESLSDRGTAMKQLLLDAYKEKLFAETDLLKGEEKNKSNFAKAFLETMNKQTSIANKGITIETLTMIRSRFILDWYTNYGARFPFKLFDFHRQLLQEGMFDAYNQWLFGPVENLAAYDAWTKTHAEQYAAFTNFQKNKVFKIPVNQYYNQ
jgi:tetratricopeptide (TPR) repeat protein